MAETERKKPKGGAIMNKKIDSLYAAFTKLVKRYKHSHGVKNLHIYTDEILAQI